MSATEQAEALRTELTEAVNDAILFPSTANLAWVEKLIKAAADLREKQIRAEQEAA